MSSAPEGSTPVATEVLYHKKQRIAQPWWRKSNQQDSYLLFITSYRSPSRLCEQTKTWLFNRKRAKAFAKVQAGTETHNAARTTPWKNWVQLFTAAVVAFVALIQNYVKNNLKHSCWAGHFQMNNCCISTAREMQWLLLVKEPLGACMMGHLATSFSEGQPTLARKPRLYILIAHEEMTIRKDTCWKGSPIKTSAYQRLLRDLTSGMATRTSTHLPAFWTAGVAAP